MDNEENITMQETPATNASPTPESAPKQTAKQILTARIKACQDGINADVAANVATVIEALHDAAHNNPSGYIIVEFVDWDDITINTQPVDLTWKEIYGGFPVNYFPSSVNVEHRISDLFTQKLHEALLEEGLTLQVKPSFSERTYALWSEDCKTIEEELEEEGDWIS